MKILVTNDDGINAQGLYQLVKAAKNFGEVWVVAPNSQRSCISHKISYGENIDVRAVDYPVDGVKAFSCSGTPTDCVRVGVLKLIPGKPDVVLSGINDGYNIASDIQYSGTANAAFEAAFLGVRAIALSEDSFEHHEVTDAYLEKVLEKYITKSLGKDQIWNVNFPSCSLEDCKGILENRTVSKDGFYVDDYSEELLEDGTRRYVVLPARNWNGSEGTDLAAVADNYVSVGLVNNVS